MAHVLVVDDEPDILKLVGKTLEAEGHRVSLARDGVEALEAVARERPDLVIVDLQLPRLDGFEVCRRLKGADETRALPIIMLTANYVSVDDARAGVGLGADEYVVKPFLREILLHNVARLLGPS